MIKLNKIDNFTKIKKYYCLKHKRIHYKYKNGKKTKTFSNKKCQENGYSLTTSEKFKMNFNKNWKNYSIKKHRKSIGSNKQ